MDGFSSFTEGYEYIAFPDGTKITFSNILTSDNGEKYVRVFVRQWDVEKDRFNTINMNLPSGRIIYKVGFSEDVADDHIRHICTLKNVIWECAEEKTEESVKENKRLMKEYTFLIPRNRESASDFQMQRGRKKRLRNTMGKVAGFFLATSRSQY